MDKGGQADGLDLSSEGGGRITLAFIAGAEGDSCEVACDIFNQLDLSNLQSLHFMCVKYFSKLLKDKFR